MAVGQTRKEIRPGDRARISIGYVDLELRNNDKGAGKKPGSKANVEVDILARYVARLARA
jgi:riboflavin synthase alpha subunit